LAGCAGLCTTCQTCCNMCVHIVQHAVHVVRMCTCVWVCLQTCVVLLLQVVNMMCNIMQSNFNTITTSCTTFSLTTICPMNTFEGKYPGGLVRQQPWPPSFACAKAETTVAGFLERQRLQFDMRAPLGRTSCFCIRTTVT